MKPEDCSEHSVRFGATETPVGRAGVYPNRKGQNHVTCSVMPPIHPVRLNSTVRPSSFSLSLRIAHWYLQQEHIAKHHRDKSTQSSALRRGTSTTGSQNHAAMQRHAALECRCQSCLIRASHQKKGDV